MERTLGREDLAHLRAPLVERGILPVVALPHPGVLDHTSHATGRRRHHDDALAGKDRLLDRVGDKHLRVSPAAPQTEKHVLQVLPPESVERR